MTLDANGIWQYDEFEDAAPVSTLLNKLAGSVSDEIGPLVARQSQVVPVLLMTNGNCHIWMRGDLVGLAWEARIGTATHNTVVANLPSDYWPMWTVTINLVPNSAVPDQVFVQIDAAGEVRYFQYGSSAATTTVRGSAVWPTTAP